MRVSLMAFRQKRCKNLLFTCDLKMLFYLFYGLMNLLRILIQNSYTSVYIYEYIYIYVYTFYLCCCTNKRVTN